MANARENTVQVLERISLVIDFLAAQEEPLSLSVIAEKRRFLSPRYIAFCTRFLKRGLWCNRIVVVGR